MGFSKTAIPIYVMYCFEKVFLSKVTMKAVPQVLINCLRYIFIQEMKFVWKVLLGLLVLFLFYFSRIYFAELLKEFLDVYSHYSCTDIQKVCLFQNGVNLVTR